MSKKTKKRFSYRERRNHHTDIMRNAFNRGGKLNKKESYSAGFVHWNSDTSTYNSVKGACSLKAFRTGEKAGAKAYNKAMDYKF